MLTYHAPYSSNHRSKTLQTPDLDLYEAVEEVENVALALIQMRNDEEELKKRKTCVIR